MTKDSMTLQQLIDDKRYREIDVLVAKHIMSYYDIFMKEGVPYGRPSGRSVLHAATVLPFWHRDIADAWTVVENFKGDGNDDFIVSWRTMENEYQAWVVRNGDYCDSGSDYQSFYADTAPLAICVTALKAVGIK